MSSYLDTITDDLVARGVVCHDDDCPTCAWWRDILAARLAARGAAEIRSERVAELALLAGAEANANRLERVTRLVLPLAWAGLVAIVLGTILLATTAEAGAAPLFGAALALDAAAVLIHRATR